MTKVPLQPKNWQSQYRGCPRKNPNSPGRELRFFDSAMNFSPSSFLPLAFYFLLWPRNGDREPPLSPAVFFPTPPPVSEPSLKEEREQREQERLDSWEESRQRKIKKILLHHNYPCPRPKATPSGRKAAFSFRTVIISAQWKISEPLLVQSEAKQAKPSTRKER